MVARRRRHPLVAASNRRALLGLGRDTLHGSETRIGPLVKRRGRRLRLSAPSGGRVIAQLVAAVPQLAPVWKSRNCITTAALSPGVQRRGSRGTNLSADRHRARRARCKQEGRCLVLVKGAVILHEASRAQRKDMTTRQSKPPSVEGSGGMAMPDEDSDKRVSCSSDPWRLRSWGFIPSLS